MSNHLFSSFKNISVLGASGKMGRGIVLLFARRILEFNLKHKEKHHLFAIDVSLDGLEQMLLYIELQSIKYAEKNSQAIRELYTGYPNLVNELDYVRLYTKDIQRLISVSDTLESTHNSELVFEAVAENVNLKTRLLQSIDKKSSVCPFFFTNTSSIPISTIEKEADIEGRIIGMHFYNPPPVQKLLEIIRTKNTQTELVSLADEIARVLKKTVIYAPDCAGFIGNGQFLREVSYALDLVHVLSKDYGIPGSIYLINEVTRELLLRPMGIFEVVDYVGVNVCDSIMSVMQQAFPNEAFNNSLLLEWIQAGVLGGQDTKGKTKNGIFKYEEGQITGVFHKAKYNPTEILSFGNIARLSWKDLKSDKSIKKTLKHYFSGLHTSKNPFAEIAIQYGKACNSIGEELVVKKIAFSKNDVNEIMTLGFHHLYGPVNSFFDSSLVTESVHEDGF